MLWWQGNFGVLMSNGTWKEAIAQLTPLVGPPTSEQRELASVANLSLKRGVPRLVAAAQLRDSLSDSLHIRRYLRAPAPDSMVDVIVELYEGARAPLTLPLKSGVLGPC